MAKQSRPGAKRRKRIIAFVSNKGGIGKTTACRVCIDLTRRAGRTVAAYDLDGKTQSLAIVYRNPDPLTGVAPDDVANRESTAWVNAFRSDADDVFLDVPGGRLDDLAATFDAGAHALVDLAHQYDRDVVIVSVIGIKTDAVVPLADTIATFKGSDVHHVVIKNGLYAPEDQFLLFDGFTHNGERKFGKMSDLAKSVGAEVVWMRRLDAIPDTLADILQYTYADAATKNADSELGLRHAANVGFWLDDVERRFTGTWLDPHHAEEAATEAVAGNG